MADANIRPHRITKPIQLLAAWLAGLAIVNGSFLAAAATIHTPSWITGTLVLASILNVPIFLLSLFILQTKFRPEMQEDSYYSEYLQKKYSSPKIRPWPQLTKNKMKEISSNIVKEVAPEPKNDQSKKEQKVEKILRESEVDYLTNRVLDNRTLSELHMYPNLWKELVRTWGDSSSFKEELDNLVELGLVDLSGNAVELAKLTKTGETVAKKLETEGSLWNQKNGRHMKLESTSKSD